MFIKIFCSLKKNKLLVLLVIMKLITYYGYNSCFLMYFFKCFLPYRIYFVLLAVSSKEQ